MSFKTLATQTLADNYTFPSEQSTVLRVAASNNININGVNVIVKKPEVGDVLCITKNTDASGNLLGPDSQQRVWVKSSTLDINTFPVDSYEPVGVVYKVKGNHAWVIYRTASSSLKWAAATRYKFSGVAMSNGTSYTIIVTMTTTPSSGSVSTTVLYSGAMQCTSKSAFYSQINSIITSNSASKAVMSVNNDIVNNEVYLNCADTSSNKYTMIIRNASTGVPLITTTDITGGDYGAVTPRTGLIYRDNYAGAGYALTSIDTCAVSPVYTQLGRTPSSNITSTIDSELPVNLNAFTSNTYCSLLRSTYGTYKNYIASYKATWPIAGESAFAKTATQGRKITGEFAAATYTVPSTTTSANLYPAATYCNNVSVNHTDLVAGKWYMGSAVDMYEIYSQIKLDDDGNQCDAISKTYIKLNGGTSTSGGFQFTSAPFNKASFTVTSLGTKPAIATSLIVGSTSTQSHALSSNTVIPITDIDF